MLEIYENLELNDLVIDSKREEWKQICEIEGLEMFKDYYYVSNFGRVKSIGGRFSDRVLKQSDNGKGYLFVKLQTSDGKHKQMRVNRLVAFVYISGYEDGLVCNHLDEDSKNNQYNNLEWITQKQNVNYGTAIQRRVEKQSMPVIGECIKTGKVIRFESTAEAGRNGFSQGNVASCCRGDYLKKCRHGGTDIYRGYKWKYEEEEENV